MFEGYYAEHVVRNREQERTQVLAMKRMEGVAGSEENRPILSTGWNGWSWRRARAVLGTVGIALVASLALPASVQGVAWGLRGMLELMGR